MWTVHVYGSLHECVLADIESLSYWIISEDEAEEKKLAPIEVVYVGSGGTGISPKTGRKGMLCLFYTFAGVERATKYFFLILKLCTKYTKTRIEKIE